MAALESLTAAVTASTATSTETNRLVGLALERIDTGTGGTGPSEAAVQAQADALVAANAISQSANLALATKLGA